MPTVVRPDAKEILTKLISDKGLKQNYVADKIGISEQSMSALVHGHKKFTADIAIQIGNVLNVSPNIFLDKSYS